MQLVILVRSKTLSEHLEHLGTLATLTGGDAERRKGNSLAEAGRVGGTRLRGTSSELLKERKCNG